MPMTAYLGVRMARRTIDRFQPNAQDVRALGWFFYAIILSVWTRIVLHILLRLMQGINE